MAEGKSDCKLFAAAHGSGILEHLCKKRKLAARVFPHCGERGYGFSRFVQGQKLSMASLRALKRI